MAVGIGAIESLYSRLWADRRVEVGLPLLCVSAKQYRINPRVQGILCDAVYERCFAK